MNFHGSLNFEGNILQWAKKKEDGRIELVFDGGGDETVLTFSENCLRPMYSALTKIIVEGAISAETKDFKNCPASELHGKGKVTLDSIIVDLEHDRVSIEGESGINMDDSQAVDLVIKSADQKSYIVFGFNDRQAVELAGRFQKIADGRRSLREAMQKKTVPVSLRSINR